MTEPAGGSRRPIFQPGDRSGEADGGVTQTAAATFSATLIDEFVRGGVVTAIVCPGSRSTPLALAVAADPRIDVHVFHDERAGSMAALGVGLATGHPAIVITTSGTAVVEMHAAVVEAHQSAVPLIVCTADRPPELRGFGSPQTVDQTHVFGSSVRWFHDPGPPDELLADTWRSLASRAVIEATGPMPGPVHLNLPFREPLVGSPSELPPGGTSGSPWHARRVAVPLQWEQGGDPVERGVIVAGRGVGAETVASIAEQTGWPVVAEPRSPYWARSLSAADAFLRSEQVARRLQPEVVLWLGEPPASKVLAQWAAASGADQWTMATATWSSGPGGRWITPDRQTRLVSMLPARHAATPGWAALWSAVEAAAQSAISAAVSDEPSSEAAIARSLIEGLAPASGQEVWVVAASSMPVRDIEWFAKPRPGVTVAANRGANGIDGVVSTAVGVALSGRPTVAFVGDIAMLHDSTALIALADRPIDLTIVVIDNDGGGIFSFLPQASTLQPEVFEMLFGTPHGTDIAALARSHRIVTSVVNPPGITDAVAEVSGVRLAVVPIDRQHNVEAIRDVHEWVGAAVLAALDE